MSQSLIFLAAIGLRKSQFQIPQFIVYYVVHFFFFIILNLLNVCRTVPLLLKYFSFKNFSNSINN